MILLNIFASVEFYVILVVIAAAIAIAAAMPSSRGEARNFFYTARLLETESPATSPGVTFTYDDHGNLTVFRTGITGLTSSGALSLAVTIIGTDVTIEERLSNGYSADPPRDAAQAALDCLGRQRYHIRYISDNMSTAFSMTLDNGARHHRELK